MKKIFLMGFLAILVLTGCSQSNKAIEVSGSTSVAPLLEKLAEAYTKDSGVEVNVNADGSSAGIKAANEGISNIGMSSRELKKEEKDYGLTENVIAKDAIAIIVNKENKVANLTEKQVQDIFTGKIKNWKEVGGADLPIVVVSREEGSGTRGAFEEILGLLNDDESSKVTAANPIIGNSSGAILENVKGKKGSIGYISLGSLDDSVNSVKFNGVQATDDNVLKGKYLISRPFLLLGKDENEETKEFIKFIMSDKGQEIVKKEGYIKVN